MSKCVLLNIIIAILEMFFDLHESMMFSSMIVVNFFHLFFFLQLKNGSNFKKICPWEKNDLKTRKDIQMCVIT